MLHYATLSFGVNKWVNSYGFCSIIRVEKRALVAGSIILKTSRLIKHLDITISDNWIWPISGNSILWSCQGRLFLTRLFFNLYVANVHAIVTRLV